MRFLGLCLLVTMGLASCQKPGADLVVYFNDVRSKPGGQVQPLPDYPPYKAFEYSAMNMRAPFEKPQNVVAVAIDYTPNVKPDANRPAHPLESFAVEQLSLVGMLSQNGQKWSLIKAPSGRIHRITEGDYLGDNYGKVTEITDNFVAFIELVPAGQGRWRERPRTLKLNSTEQ